MTERASVFQFLRPKWRRLSECTCNVQNGYPCDRHGQVVKLLRWRLRR